MHHGSNRWAHLWNTHRHLQIIFQGNSGGICHISKDRFDFLRKNGRVEDGENSPAPKVRSRQSLSGPYVGSAPAHGGSDEDDEDMVGTHDQPFLVGG